MVEKASHCIVLCSHHLPSYSLGRRPGGTPLRSDLEAGSTTDWPSFLPTPPPAPLPSSDAPPVLPAHVPPTHPLARRMGTSPSASALGGPTPPGLASFVTVCDRSGKRQSSLLFRRKIMRDSRPSRHGPRSSLIHYSATQRHPPTPPLLRASSSLYPQASQPRLSRRPAQHLMMPPRTPRVCVPSSRSPSDGYCADAGVRSRGTGRPSQVARDAKCVSEEEPRALPLDAGVSQRVLLMRVPIVTATHSASSSSSDPTTPPTTNTATPAATGTSAPKPAPSLPVAQPMPSPPPPPPPPPSPLSTTAPVPTSTRSSSDGTHAEPVCTECEMRGREGRAMSPQLPASGGREGGRGTHMLPYSAKGFFCEHVQRLLVPTAC